ncbi:MAG: FecR domain-containing protein [Kiritimatiellae bacterium]|nr:FecR domain-containing protein [Kiritimatiellia bacterium]
MKDEDFAILTQGFLDGTLDAPGRTALELAVRSDAVRRVQFEGQARLHIELAAAARQDTRAEVERRARLIFECASEERRATTIVSVAEVLGKRSAGLPEERAAGDTVVLREPARPGAGPSGGRRAGRVVPWFSWRRVAGMAAAALVAAAVVSGGYWGLARLKRPWRSRAVAWSAGTGTHILAGAEVTTGPDTPMRVALRGGGAVVLDSGTAMAFPKRTRRARFVLKQGSAHFDLPPLDGAALVVATGRGEVEVRGTTFFVSADERQTSVSLFDGKTVLRRGAQSLEMTPPSSAALGESGPAPAESMLHEAAKRTAETLIRRASGPGEDVPVVLDFSDYRLLDRESIATGRFRLAVERTGESYVRLYGGSSLQITREFRREFQLVWKFRLAPGRHRTTGNDDSSTRFALDIQARGHAVGHEPSVLACTATNGKGRWAWQPAAGGPGEQQPAWTAQTGLAPSDWHTLVLMAEQGCARLYVDGARVGVFSVGEGLPAAFGLRVNEGALDVNRVRMESIPEGWYAQSMRDG